MKKQMEKLETKKMKQRPNETAYTPWNPQEQKWRNPETKDTSTNCWTACLPSRTCLSALEYPSSDCSDHLWETHLAHNKTVPFGPLSWTCDILDYSFSQLWSQAESNMCTINHFFCCLSWREKKSTHMLFHCKDENPEAQKGNSAA